MGCGSRRVVPDASTQVTRDGVATIGAGWLKDKGDKFDVNLTLRNENPEKGMIVLLSDMTCKRGNVVGNLKHTFFNTGERTIDFRPGELKSFNLVCDLNSRQRGDFSVHVRRVWDNPNGDGKTTGKVISENLEWKQPEKI